MVVHCEVCQGEFDGELAVSLIEDEEDRIFFCSSHCRHLFDQSPENFVDGPDDERPGDRS